MDTAHNTTPDTTPDTTPGREGGVAGEHLELLRRLKASYLSSSLTILSIIQGVALAYLAAQVASGAARFTAAQWVMALVTFSVLILVWIQITIDTMTFAQIPDLPGAVVPFVVGAMELWLAAAITLRSSAWLVGSAVLVSLSSLGFARVNWLAAREPENAGLFARVRRMRGSAQVYNVLGIVLFVALVVADLTGGFRVLDGAVELPGAAATGAALLSGLWSLGWLLRSFSYWRHILTYARTGK
jgi:hypothetical protein